MQTFNTILGLLGAVVVAGIALARTIAGSLQLATATGDFTVTETVRYRATGRAAADATLDEAMGGSPYRRSGRTGTVTAVRYYPDAAIVGADTNSLTLSLLNGGNDGTGTTSVATLALVAAAGTKNKLVDFALTLSGTAANLDIDDEDVLIWRSEKVGTGLLDPGGIVEVDIQRA